MKLTTKNLSGYYTGISIPKAITQYLGEFKGKLLDVGCGSSPYKELFLSNKNVTKYISLDLENGIYENNPEYKWDGKTMPFENNSIDTIIMTEVLEHVPNINLILSECYRVLNKDGLVFFTIPFLWPLHDIPYDEYRYTPYSLKRIFEENHFINIEIKARGGWDASLAQILGLWVNIRPLHKTKRTVLQFIFKPIIKYLIEKDKPPKDFDSNHLMFCGLYGIMYK